ncbi:MAG: hypothetical protein KGQ51_18690 [Planctomycetes bacterium]|nr:hypothetical protein [Planctomycetota bacterium]
MSIVAQIKDRLRKKRAEQITEGYPAYREVLLQVIEGREDSIDPMELEAILQSVGKSLDDIESDSELLKKRLAWSKELEAGNEARTKLPKESVELQELRTELQRITDDLNAKIQAQAEIVRGLEHQVSYGASATWSLERPENCIDTGIAERIAVIDRRRQSVIQEINTIAHPTMGSRNPHAVELARTHLAKWERELRVDPSCKYTRRQYQRWADVVSGCENNLASQDSIVAELNASLRELDAEREQIRKEMLKP